MKKLIQSLVVAGLMAAAGSVALAQPGGMMGHEGMKSHRDPAKMEKMHAMHLADMKTKLKITAPQEAAWTAFTTSMKPAPGMMAQRPDRAEMDKLTTPERIDKMKAMRTQRMADMNAQTDKRDEAAKSLYAALSPEQRKTFDAEHRRMGGREGRGMHGDMHGGMHHKG
jgi:hypothetical protein